jgi:glycosyltransferase involved in cell wall biosynthesis
MTGTNLSQIALIGNYLPRQCGIATFTTDLAEAIAGQCKSASVFAVPVNDQDEGYRYPPRVQFEIVENEVASYRRAAQFLNFNNVDVVCLQHEYGIFGGVAGSHILVMLKLLRMPVITTLHTVLKDPDPHQRRVMCELVSLSDRLVVMAERAAKYLVEIYGAPEEKIDFIHHGIPDVPFDDPNLYKDPFGIAGKKVMLTFGLLSENKGIEHALEALPRIVERHPDVMYMVQGATHPNIVRSSGESYRLRLQRLAEKNGVESYVIFHNRFVSLEELVKYIGAADICLFPYLNLRQMVSGALAYTVGAGKAVISTPIWYAEELLADGRGAIVPERNAKAIAEKVSQLFDQEAELTAMRKRAHLYGRDMTWPNVACAYVRSFQRAIEKQRQYPRQVPGATLDQLPRELPRLKLDHLRVMTDGTGIVQHAKYGIPDYNHGYCTDDNARALVLTVLLENHGEKGVREAEALSSRYLAFLLHAFNSETNQFRNFMSYDRRWLDEGGTDDSQGRALWALGCVAGRSKHDGLCGVADHLYTSALVAAQDYRSPRACAFTLIAIHEYLRRAYGHRLSQDVRKQMAEFLLSLYEENKTGDWRWFEDRLAYANAKLPHALLLSGRWMERADMVDAAIGALDWLSRVQRPDDGHFVPIGSNGFYIQGKERARFDQQAIEAYSMVSACLEAHRITGDKRWFKEAEVAFDWFIGGNDLGAWLYDASSGGCYDGLHPNVVNHNQGAESTIVFLLALVEMTLAEHVIQEGEGQ